MLSSRERRETGGSVFVPKGNGRHEDQRGILLRRRQKALIKTRINDTIIHSTSKVTEVFSSKRRAEIALERRRQEVLDAINLPVEDFSYLNTPDSAPDAYTAVGRWWAQAIIKGGFENGGASGADKLASTMAQESSDERLGELAPKLSTFARAVTYLSREQGTRFLLVDYDPAPGDGDLLREAAAIAGIPTDRISVFPWMRYTFIDENTGNAYEGVYQGKGAASPIWTPDKE